MIYPKLYLDSVKEITIDVLNKNRIQGLILDVDNTLIDFDRKMPEGIKECIEGLKQKGIKCCILSNSNKLDKVRYVANELDIPFLYFAKKPLKIGFNKAKKLLELEVENIAVVGDQIMTDVIGANRSHMFSILVKPIKEKDYLITKIKRPLEQFIIKKYLKKNKENSNIGK